MAGWPMRIQTMYGPPADKEDAMRIDAILFDMDGVLVDSEPVITKAAMLALREYGIQATESDFHPFTGMGEDRFIGGVAEKHGIPYDLKMKKRTYEIYLEIVGAEIGTYPGISVLMKELRDMGLRTAVASSADAIKVNANLPAAGIDACLFDAICSGEDVTHKKPAPDIFLLAAKKLGVAPAYCLVIEDALSGIAAARAAGMQCLAISSTFPEWRLREAGAIEVLPETRLVTGWITSERTLPEGI